MKLLKYDFSWTHIFQIEEILNVSLFKNYESKKAQMLTQGMKEDEINEKQLWHGPLVNTDVIVSVSNFGFNRNYCNYSKGINHVSFFSIISLVAFRTGFLLCFSQCQCSFLDNTVFTKITTSDDQEIDKSFTSYDCFQRSCGCE